jgi:hypothetical protein
MLIVRLSDRDIHYLYIISCRHSTLFCTLLIWYLQDRIHCINISYSMSYKDLQTYIDYKLSRFKIILWMSHIVETTTETYSIVFKFQFADNDHRSLAQKTKYFDICQFIELIRGSVNQLFFLFTIPIKVYTDYECVYKNQNFPIA